MADAIVTFCGVRKSAIVYFGGTLALLCLIGSVFRNAYFFLWFLVSLWSFVSLFCLPSRKLRAFVFKTICIKRRKRSSVRPIAAAPEDVEYDQVEPIEEAELSSRPTFRPSGYAFNEEFSAGQKFEPVDQVDEKKPGPKKG